MAFAIAPHDFNDSNNSNAFNGSNDSNDSNGLTLCTALDHRGTGRHQLQRGTGRTQTARHLFFRVAAFITTRTNGFPVGA